MSKKIRFLLVSSFLISLFFTCCFLGVDSSIHLEFKIFFFFIVFIISFCLIDLGYTAGYEANKKKEEENK